MNTTSLIAIMAISIILNIYFVYRLYVKDRSSSAYKFMKDKISLKRTPRLDAESDPVNKESFIVNNI